MSRDQLYPLMFNEILKEKIWGGSRIRPWDSGPREPLGESWHLVDLDQDQSRVSTGPLTGSTLGQLLQSFGPSMMGPAQLDGGSFPLLVKTIDTAQTLSVQVHPDAVVARRLGGRPKSEAWYILEASAGAKIFCGLQPGVNRSALEQAIRQGRVEECLLAHPAQAGELYPIFPGTVHAIGGGIYLAEVQQPSDTTYRLYDWGRVGFDGRPRDLHIDQALQSIDFDQTVELPTTSTQVDMGCFQFELRTLDAGQVLGLEGAGPLVIVGLSGEAQLIWRGEVISLSEGGVMLVPHSCRDQATLGGREKTRALLASFPIRAQR